MPWNGTLRVKVNEEDRNTWKRDLQHEAQNWGMKERNGKQQ